MDRYGKRDESGNIITPVEIPKIHTSEQKEEILEWARIIKDILWSKARQTYKWRDWKIRETLFEKAWHSLFLQYGPTFVEDDWSIANEHYWLEDFVNVKDFLKTSSWKNKK